MDKAAQHTKIIKGIANELGFEACGVARARHLVEEEANLKNWLNLNYHGQMGYMANHFDKRLDPTKLVPGAKSVVSLLYNYYPKKDLADKGTYRIAKYTYGKDYHLVIRDKLKLLLERIREEIGEVEGRAFVDSAPVMERQWAQIAGLGWLGKNGLLLNKKMGSFFFIAELIIDLELVPDTPVTDHCGTCTRCIDACPTEAIVQPGLVDGSKCISYFTIELKAENTIPTGHNMENWIFGCDICQDICPWNRHAKPHQEPEFNPSEDLMAMNDDSWEEMTEEVFGRMFGKSAIKRTKLKGLQRNVAYIKKTAHQ